MRVFLILQLRAFFYFFSILLLPGKKKYFTLTESFLFAFLYNLLFYQFVILLICLSCVKAFIRVIIRELSDYFVVVTNWVLLCPAWWMGWTFLYFSGSQILLFLTLIVLPWCVKSSPSTEYIKRNSDFNVIKENPPAPRTEIWTTENRSKPGIF